LRIFMAKIDKSFNRIKFRKKYSLKEFIIVDIE
jgi:hypothetical protein